MLRVPASVVAIGDQGRVIVVVVFSICYFVTSYAPRNPPIVMFRHMNSRGSPEAHSGIILPILFRHG